MASRRRAVNHERSNAVSISEDLVIIWPELYGRCPEKGKPIRYKIMPSGCWECTSHRRDKDGYTQIRRNGQSKRLHRLVYEIKISQINDDEVVLHSCDNPACFNPDHLSKGSNFDNQMDKVYKGRQAKGVINGRAKLTDEIVRLIRSDNRSGKVVGKEFGVSDAVVYLIKHRRIWKHVD
jgi:hypothetical protein